MDHEIAVGLSNWISTAAQKIMELEDSLAASNARIETLETRLSIVVGKLSRMEESDEY